MNRRERKALEADKKKPEAPAPEKKEPAKKKELGIDRKIKNTEGEES